MRNRRRHLVGTSAALLFLLAAAAPAWAAQKPFLMPQPRPTEHLPRPAGSKEPDRIAYTVPEAPDSPACSQHFCVHWVDQGLDAPSPADRNGNGIPDFVEQVLEVAEHVHQVENEDLGWREPKSDGSEGGGEGKTDVYLIEIGSELFGYASPDRGQADKQHEIPRHLHGYLVLDNDYSAFEFPGTKPLNDLEVTFAHEYNHILQFAYDAYQDPWFAEATATWMEDQVYNQINDYLSYVRDWVPLYETPLTTTSIKMYGSAVWNEWLARRYGRAFIRKVWAGAIDAKPAGFAIAAYERALRAAKAPSFSHEFTHFAAAVAEWRTGRGFRESQLYPDVPRQGRLPLNGERLTRPLNHTTFELLRVRARSGRAVVVHLTAPRGTAAGLALVGRLGSERQGRTVNRIAYSRGGGQLTVRLRDPGRFQRITAVVVNADARAHGFSTPRLDWRYLTDRFPFELSGRLVR